MDRGGRPFVTPSWRLFRQPVTVHNLGGARMSTDPSTGVVDPDGEVFGHPGLFVLDGATLPGPTGGNPSLTIAAIAERCVEAAIRRICAEPGWAAPERSLLVPGPVPEDAAVRAVVAHGARPLAHAGVRFQETLRGAAAVPPGAERRKVTLRLRVRIADLRELLADPVHSAEVTGTVFVDGLTSRPAAVLGGTLHILARVEGGPRRTMDYSLPFNDDAGVRWLLQGAKKVERHGWRGPWRATTVLDLALTAPEERYDALAPTGRARISPLAAARLVVTIRPTGAVGPRSAAALVIRFGRFFIAEVARAFLPKRPPRH